MDIGLHLSTLLASIALPDMSLVAGTDCTRSRQSQETPPSTKGCDQPLKDHIGSGSHVVLEKAPISASKVLSISPITDTSLPSSPLGPQKTTIRGLSRCDGSVGGGELSCLPDHLCAIALMVFLEFS